MGFKIENGVLKKYNQDYDDVTDVVVPDGVTHIGEGVFSGCSSLKSIILPDGVTRIGEGAFAGCSSLTEVTLPKRLTISREVYRFSKDAGEDKKIPVGSEGIKILYANDTHSVWRECVLSADTTGEVTLDSLVAAFSDLLDNIRYIRIPEYRIEGKDAKRFWKYREEENGITITDYKGEGNCVLVPSHIGKKPVTKIKRIYCDGEKLFVSEGITTIAENAFSAWENLEDVYLPMSLQRIENSACKGLWNLKKVSMPEGVKHIGKEAFFGCTMLTNFAMPNSVTSIGARAFWGCTLRDLSFSSSITEIPKEAFYGCSLLQKVILPDGVTSIGEGAFSDCQLLDTVQIPASVTFIAPDAFLGTLRINNFSVDEKNERYFAKEGCLIEKATKKIIRGTQIGIIPVDENIEVIGKKAYEEFCSIDKITVPSGIKKIEDHAFARCKSLRSVRFPKGLESVGTSAFQYCFALQSITVKKGNKKYTVTEGCLIEKDKKKLIWAKQDLVLPQDGSIASIGDYVFADCAFLTSITLPDGVTTIGKEAFARCQNFKDVKLPAGLRKISEKAFALCEALTEVVIPDGVTSIGKGAFWRCNRLEKVVIPDSVTFIGDDAFFGCKSLREIRFPKDLQTDFLSAIAVREKDGSISMEGRPLVGYYGQKKFDVERVRCPIIYPAYPFEEIKETYRQNLFLEGFFAEAGAFDKEQSKPYIDYILSQYSWITRIFTEDKVDILYAFAEANEITLYRFYKIFFPLADKKNAFQCKTFLLGWKNKNVTAADEEDFWEKEWERDPYDEEEMKRIWKYRTNEDGTITIDGFLSEETESRLNLPPRMGSVPVTCIGNNAFERSDVIDATVPDGVKRIWSCAFRGCENLRQVFLPDSIRYIGYYAFDDCRNLESIELLYGFKTISFATFRSCEKLKKILIPYSVERIEFNAFENCKSLQSVVIPSSVKRIEKGAFRNCTLLTEVFLSENLTKIESNTFDGCTSLRRISVPKGVTFIDETAFPKSLAGTSFVIRTPQGSYAEGYARTMGYATETCLQEEFSERTKKAEAVSSLAFLLRKIQEKKE